MLKSTTFGVGVKTLHNALFDCRTWDCAVFRWARTLAAQAAFSPKSLAVFSPTSQAVQQQDEKQITTDLQSNQSLSFRNAVAIVCASYKRHATREERTGVRGRQGGFKHGCLSGRSSPPHATTSSEPGFQTVRTHWCEAKWEDAFRTGDVIALSDTTGNIDRSSVLHKQQVATAQRLRKQNR